NVDGAKTATSKVKQVGQVIVDKTDQVFTSAVETGKEKADSIKETTGTITRDVKDAAIGSVDKIGGFFNGLGKKSKDAKDNVSQKAEAAGKVIADTTTETVEATEQKIIDSSRQMGEALKDAKQQTMDTAQTGVDKLKIAGQKVIEKTDQIVTSAAETTKQETDSMKQAAGTVSEDASNIAAEGADKVGAFFSSLDKTAKSAGDDVSQKVKDTEKAVVGATEETVKATQQKTTELTKETGKTLKEAKEKTVVGVGTAIGQVKETGQEGVGKAEVETTDKGKGAIESIKEAKEGITGLFSGFGKKKDKKKDKRKQGGAKERVSAINQQIGGDLSDINQFLAEERDKMAEERMATPETKVKSEISQSPVVTSPTLPRRVASHRIARGDVPYFVEVTNLSYDDSSSDESYIVTEPTERLSARISDESSIDSLHIKKPLFHIESEDSFDASHRGSIISNDNLSAQRPETLVTDLDDFDDTASSDTQFTSNVLFKGSTDAKTASQIDTDLIEKKLSDIEKALGTLEHAETIESTQTEKPSLKRVERKFERMASELLAADSVKAKDSNLTTPEMEEKHEQDFRKIVSQLSTEEMSDCQKEYAALWDEQTFSPSEGCDTSKTPDSQAEVLELPQGDIIYMGPVTLNKDHMINKAGIEVDVIPIMKSPCPSLSSHKRSKKRAKSELGFHSKPKHDSDRGSLPDLHDYKKGVIMDTIMRMSPNVFLSNPHIDSNESVSSFLRSDDRMAKSLGSNDSLSRGLITNAVTNWLQKSSPFGSVDNMTQSVSSNQTSTFDDTDLTEASGSRQDSQIPDIFISEDEVLVLPRYSPKTTKKSRRRNKRSKLRREKCSVEQTPLGEASGLQQQRSEQPTAPQTLSRAEAEETSGQRQSSEQERPIVDQHMLSDEMKKLLKELEEESKK
ncbi:hypothetical protein AMK59_7601, partial [Oryctes borbonicus]